ncbi:MAG: ABC transporter permease [Crenarchaeota archaeon]|nr:ABC transporter permease [Thermoproteota archaeon]
MRVEEVLEVIGSKESGSVSPWDKVIIAMIRRAKIRFNYKIWIVFDFANTFFMVLTYFLLAFIVKPESISQAGYGQSYFTFALIGIAISHYVTASLRSLSITLRFEQFHGTLESVLSTPTSFIIIFLGDVLYYFLYSTAFLVLIIGIGLALNAALVINLETILTLSILVILLVLANLPIGIISAAMVLRFKQGDPIGWLITWINNLLSGVFFPVLLLPTQLRFVSLLLPLTFSLDAIRYSLIWGANLLHSRIIRDILYMVIYIVVGYPISIKIFSIAYDSVRKRGELSAY